MHSPKTLYWVQLGLISILSLTGSTAHSEAPWQPLSPEELGQTQTAPEMPAGIPDGTPKPLTETDQNLVSSSGPFDMSSPAPENAVGPNASSSLGTSDIQTSSFVEIGSGAQAWDAGGWRTGVPMRLQLGWNCRFQGTNFIAGVIGGGAWIFGGSADLLMAEDSQDTGYVNAAFRFGWAFGRWMPFCKLGWAYDRYAFGPGKDTCPATTWFNELLVGVGCDVNLMPNIALGVDLSYRNSASKDVPFLSKTTPSEDINKRLHFNAWEFALTLKYQFLQTRN